MSDQSLKNIVAQLKDARATAAVAIDSVEPRHRAGVEGRVRQAERSIKELEDLYREAVLKSIAVVAITGDGAKAFAAAVADSMLCVSQNLVVDIVSDGISSRLARYSGFGGQELNALLGELNEIRAKYGIFSIPPIKDNGIAREVASMSLRDAVAKVLKVNYGFQIHSAVIRRTVADLALERLYTGSGKLVVGVYDYEGVEPLLLPEPAASVKISGDVTEEVVKAALESIRNKLSGKNQKKQSGKSATQKQESQ